MQYGYIGFGIIDQRIEVNNRCFVYHCSRIESRHKYRTVLVKKEKGFSHQKYIQVLASKVQ